MRYFIEFSYNGTNYHGWQRQPSAISVQEVLEDALSLFLRIPMALVGAGRTDAGVHAKQMYAHFDVETSLDIPFLIKRLNAYLPKDIAVLAIYKTPKQAHARFDATSRTYEYWITPEKSPFLQGLAHHVTASLDIDAMNKAASVLMQYSDFECFSKSNTDVRTFFCKITHAKWEYKNQMYVFTITADRFLRNMVRAIVGTLLNVGTNKYGVEKIPQIIASKDRSKAGVSVPGHALYLTKVMYPDTTFSTSI